MLSFLYVYSDHSILECYNLFSGVELSMRSFFVIIVINENSFSRWIIEKSDGITTLGLQKLSESVRDYAYLILTSQTSTRGQSLAMKHKT